MVCVKLYTLVIVVLCFWTLFVSLDLFLGDDCTGSNYVIRVTHATCVSGTVQCPNSHQGVGKSFCKAAGEAAIGEDCSGGQTCYSYGGELRQS